MRAKTMSIFVIMTKELVTRRKTWDLAVRLVTNNVFAGADPPPK